MLILLSSFIFATTTMGVINFPTTGDTVGLNFIADFNLSDDQDVNYFLKEVTLWISINDVNVLTDFNIASSYGQSNGCIARGDNNSTGSLQCTIRLSTAVREIAEGTATMKIWGFGSDDAVDSNTSNAFLIVKSYRIQDDPDINSFSQEDIQDLTQSGIAETIRNIVILLGFIVAIIVILFIAMKIIKLNKA